MTAPTAVVVREGTCHALYAFDIGREIDVERAAGVLGAEPAPPAAPGRPPYLQFSRAPVRWATRIPSLRVDGLAPECRAVVVLYEFGAASVQIEIPATGTLDDLARLSETLRSTEALAAAARRVVEDVAQRLGDALIAPSIAPLVEEYVVFHVARTEPAVEPDRWLEEARAEIAAVLRGESGDLAEQEIEHTLAFRASYTPQDAAWVDWNAALVLRERADDLVAVLAFANVQLLEMRFLDRRLEDDLQRSYGWLHRPAPVVAIRRHRTALNQVARRQIDAALLFEHVGNAPKLLGDQYLARVYEHASRRFRLPDWDGAIQRKIEVLSTVYDRLHDRAATVRAEILEWIIIVLILVSILLPLLGVGKS